MTRVFSLCLLLLISLPAIAQELRVDVPRNVYIRGESIPLTVTAPPTATGEVTVTADGVTLASQAVVGEVTALTVPTDGLRVGKYDVQVSLMAGGAKLDTSCPLIIARRPPPDRLEVWLWCYGGGAHHFNHYYDHGFTIAGGANAVRWEDGDLEPTIASLDARLERGVYSSVIACGGIAQSEMKSVDPEADDVAYLGAGRHPERFLNPWHPVVEEARASINDRFFTALGDHPAVKVAFYNTEVVDDLYTDNLNQAGIELTRQRLGYTRDERDKDANVMPGVVADDARPYRYYEYVYQEGNGLAHANLQTAQDVKRHRPDVLTLTDPYRSAAYRDMFPGMDLVGTWTYTNNDPKLMLYIETMRAMTRGIDQDPLQVVTLLNYPGTLAPRSVTDALTAAKPDYKGWMLMGPDRCKEVSWIILSRAPRILGYYFSSACSPERDTKPEDQFRVPHATSDAIKELSDRVYQPLGKLLTRLEVKPRKVAVLSSQVARTYGSSRTIGYPNEQIYGLYPVLAMAHLDGDVLLDEQVAAGALADYELLFMPYCDMITKTMYDEIRAFQQRGGVVVADQYLGAELPGVIKLDIDFSYRKKVNADAIATGNMFAAWDDHLNPNTAELAKAEGVTAEDDQRIMESYARRLLEALDTKVYPEITADSPRVLVNALEKRGVTYLALVNDNRTYGDRTGEYLAIQEKLLPLTTTITLHSAPADIYPYDLLTQQALPTTRAGETVSFTVNLTEIGGTLVALCPTQPTKLDVEVRKGIRRGESTTVAVRVIDQERNALPGLQPLSVTVTDAAGNDTEYTDYYCAEEGVFELPIVPALNDATGRWTIAVEDLTAGLSAEASFRVR